MLPGILNYFSGLRKAKYFQLIQSPIHHGYINHFAPVQQSPPPTPFLSYYDLEVSVVLSRLGIKS